MKVTRKDFEVAWEDQDSLDVYSRARFESFLDRLGIEIVPDPEPELPPRPWKVIDDTGGPVVSDGQFVLVTTGPEVTSGFRRKVLEALVAAYNAAGERKKVVLVDRAMAGPRWTYEGAPSGQAYNTPLAALGGWTKDHASDLGLEIVES